MSEFKSLAHIPPPSSKRIALRVSKEAERSLSQGYPWIYENAILDQSFDGSPGDLAVIFNSKRQFLAIGLYDPSSPIRVRIIQHRTPTPIDEGFYADRLQKALHIRESLPPETTGYRIVHGENDRFPGLVLDRYNQYIVVKLYTIAWIPHLKEILTCIGDFISLDAIILRLSRNLQKHHQYLYGLYDGEFILGSTQDPTVLFRENNLWFEADPIKGHKTGFYFDQRDNRQKVQNLAEGKSVLNLYAYSGGFSVYAAKGGAEDVTNVDISKPALAVAKRNFSRNRQDSQINNICHTVLSGDVFQILERLSYRRETFDLVIIDPPSFAKRQNETKKAIYAYQRLTKGTLKVLTPGGILVQASCSSKVKAEVFFKTVSSAAEEFGRPLIEIARTGHPLDHPILFKGGSYLKCIFAKC